MKVHNLKLMPEYAIPKIKGYKPFEIRFNDRDYQVGDLVTYTVPLNESLDDKLKGRVYKIIYITTYEQKEGYVVFAEKELQNES